MRVQVKFGGDLKRRAAGPGGTGEIESDQPLTVAEAMARLGIEDAADEVLVIVNDEVVPPSEHGRVSLNDDDRLTLMPQLKGG